MILQVVLTIFSSQKPNTMPKRNSVELNSPLKKISGYNLTKTRIVHFYEL